MSDILDFSLEVLFPVALVIFVAGVAYRVLKYVFTFRRGVYVNRPTGWGYRIWRLVDTFLHPVIFNLKTKPLELLNGFLFFHILGVILLIFLLAQHIAYIEKIIPFYGLLWPLAIPLSSSTGALTVTSPVGNIKFVNSIWGPLTLLLNGDFLTIFAVIGVFYKVIEKTIEKIKGARHVRTGDLLIWPLLFVIIVTGWLTAHHVASDMTGYRLLLGLHIASAALFVVVWPFTKYFHFIWGYWFGKLYEWYNLTLRRGV
ncbi:MAG: hypothetical protein ACP5H5_03440 [Pyrobaculum sp.]